MSISLTLTPKPQTRETAQTPFQEPQTGEIGKNIKVYTSFVLASNSERATWRVTLFAIEERRDRKRGFTCKDASLCEWAWYRAATAAAHHASSLQYRGVLLS